MLETVIVQSPLAFVLVAAESHKVTAAIEVIPGLRIHMVPTASASFAEISGQVFDPGDAGYAVALGHQGKDPGHYRTTWIRPYRRKGQEGAVCIRREETEVSFQVHPFIGEKVPPDKMVRERVGCQRLIADAVRQKQFLHVRAVRQGQRAKGGKSRFFRFAVARGLCWKNR